ncbi:acetyl-CoA C-acetyltransferase, partial [Klebsiella pneumoniae]|nr:acetyl-CoA C-acetyltransferase [Klebsiella pneumoniae]
MENIVIVSAVRTAIGNFNGALAGVSAVELGSAVVSALLKKTQLEPGLVDEVIMGNVLQAGLGQNPARQILLRSGIPESACAFTVNKVCGSGLK